jgi:hypothetical protein
MTDMTRRSRSRSRIGIVGALAIGGVAAAAGCSGGSDGGTSGETATVRVVYEAATEVDPDVVADFPACTSMVGQTHIHPSWVNWVQVSMTPEGDDRWTVRFDDVPVGERVGIRINDPNFCGESPFGSRTTAIEANGEVLVDVISTPVTGDHGDGLGFRVNADGDIDP